MGFYRKRGLIHGVGINDADYQVLIKDKNGKIIFRCPFYRKWHSMLERVYSDKWLIKSPTYEGVEVCLEWHTFSNFKSWMEKQDWEGKHLDKDLLGDGKLYSPDTCCFVNSVINSFLTDSASSRGDYPIGVSYHSKVKKFQSRCNDPETTSTKHLGYYNSPEEAHEVWRKHKHTVAVKLASKEKDTRIKEALIRRYSVDSYISVS